MCEVDKEADGAKPLRQPREGRQPKPIRQAESEIPVFALFASLANMDPRTKSELIAKKKKHALRSTRKLRLRKVGSLGAEVSPGQGGDGRRASPGGDARPAARRGRRARSARVARCGEWRAFQSAFWGFQFVSGSGLEEA